MLGDDIIISETSALLDMMRVFEATGKMVVGVQQVPFAEVDRFGIIAPEAEQGRACRVKDLIEKPQPGQAPSNIAIMGRYSFRGASDH